MGHPPTRTGKPVTENGENPKEQLLQVKTPRGLVEKDLGYRNQWTRVLKSGRVKERQRRDHLSLVCRLCSTLPPPLTGPAKQTQPR